jgi:hypothetical protein
MGIEMTQPIHTGAYWGGDPGSDDFDRLEQELGTTLTGELRSRVVWMIGDYKRSATALRDGILPAELKKKLQRVARLSRELATEFGAKDWFFDEYAFVDPPKAFPHDRIDWEVFNAVRYALMRVDSDLRKKFGANAKLRETTSAQLAIDLAVLTVGAERAVAEIRVGRGRPKGGGEQLVQSLVREFSNAGLELTCYSEAIEDSYGGNFPVVARWLKTAPMRVVESEATLCEYAKRRLAGLRQQRNKGARKGSNS